MVPEALLDGAHLDDAVGRRHQFFPQASENPCRLRMRLHRGCCGGHGKHCSYGPGYVASAAIMFIELCVAGC